MIVFQSAFAQTGMGSATVPVAAFGVSPNASPLCASASLWQKLALIRAFEPTANRREEYGEAMGRMAAKRAGANESIRVKAFLQIHVRLREFKRF